MPYINHYARRPGLLPEEPAETAGELNYQFSKLALNYIVAHGESYQTYNDIMGAIAGAQMELYRRMVAPYEDQKIKDNGDVYSPRSSTQD